MSDLTFEERNRLESEVLPAVVDDPECAALTIVILEKQLAEARAERDARVPFEDCAKASCKRCNALEPGKIIREAAAQGGEGEEA